MMQTASELASSIMLPLQQDQKYPRDNPLQAFLHHHDVQLNPQRPKLPLRDLYLEVLLDIPTSQEVTAVHDPLPTMIHKRKQTQPELGSK